MENNVLTIPVSWTGNNFCCSWHDDDAGTVVATSKTLPGLKKDFEESLKWHIEGCLEDGDMLPEYLTKGRFSLSYELDASALLRAAQSYTTLEAISRASGINAKQLSHYAAGLKKPRTAQMQRIRTALRFIGTQILALS